MGELRTYIKLHGEFFELREREPLVAGRSFECDLVLEDELASREHCSFELRDDVVRVRDLDSHNGILLNGLEIADEARVHHGDVLTVGSTVIGVVRQQREVPTSLPPRPVESDPKAEEYTNTATLEEILLRGARRSLDQGQLQEADQSGRILFPELRGRTRGESGLADSTRVDAVRLGLDLADRLGDPSWLDQILELLIAAERPLSTQAARFLAVAAAVGSPPRNLERYLDMLRAKGLPAEGLDGL